jgi:hypothetical protein
MFSENNRPKTIYILPYHNKTNSSYQTTIIVIKKTLVENNSLAIKKKTLWP